MLFVDYLYYRIYRFYIYRMHEDYEVHVSCSFVISAFYGFNILSVFLLLEYLYIIRSNFSDYVIYPIAGVIAILNLYRYSKIVPFKKLEELAEKYPISKRRKILGTLYFSLSFALLVTLITIGAIKNS